MLTVVAAEKPLHSSILRHCPQKVAGAPAHTTRRPAVRSCHRGGFRVRSAPRGPEHVLRDELRGRRDQRQRRDAQRAGRKRQRHVRRTAGMRLMLRCWVRRNCHRHRRGR